MRLVREGATLYESMQDRQPSTICEDCDGNCAYCAIAAADKMDDDIDCVEFMAQMC